MPLCGMTVADTRRSLFSAYPDEETVVDRAWSAQVMYAMFRCTYGSLFHFGGGIDDVRLGPFFGLSGREASLSALRRTRLQSW